jgi:hypothetical protein
MRQVIVTNHSSSKQAYIMYAYYRRDFLDFASQQQVSPPITTLSKPAITPTGFYLTTPRER